MVKDIIRDHYDQVNKFNLPFDLYYKLKHVITDDLDKKVEYLKKERFIIKNLQGDNTEVISENYSNTYRVMKQQGLIKMIYLDKAANFCSDKDRWRDKVDLLVEAANQYYTQGNRERLCHTIRSLGSIEPWYEYFANFYYGKPYEFS